MDTPTIPLNPGFQEDDDKTPTVVRDDAIPPTPPPKENFAPITTQLKDPGVKDFGWNSPPSKVPAPLLKGLSNDDLYTLLRRFNKQICHVKAIEQSPNVEFDLERSPDEEFSPDKLRASLERLYMTVIVGLAAFGKHIARLRSWNEPRRTAAFCAAYFIAWIFNLLFPVTLSILILLIIDKPTRRVLFPPAPLALISAKTGNLQTPKAKTLGSPDSLSGAPEAHKGEAVEQEARHFVFGVASMAVSTAVGKGPGDDGNGNAIGSGEAEAEGLQKGASSVDSSVPDPVGLVTGIAEGKHLASGDNASEDAAKKPTQDAIWDKARPALIIIADIADGWERFANALSPTYPFPEWMPRFRIAAPLLPLYLVYFIPTAILARFATFVFGFVFFAQPLIVRGARWLTTKVPNWRDYLDLRKTILLGVPTHAQLTLTLLRLAESQKAPLPPPPTSLDAPTPPSYEDEDTDADFDPSSYEVDSDHTTEDDFEHMSGSNGDRSSSSSSKETKPKRRAGQKITGLLKKTAKLGVSGALGMDHLKASVTGSEPSKQRLGAVTDPAMTEFKDPITNPQDENKTNVGIKARSEEHKPGPIENGEGPSVFSARMHGKKGYILLIESAASPCISFVYGTHASSGGGGITSFLGFGGSSSKGVDPKDLKSEVTIALQDIVELRKVGGFGWKGKMIVGWAMGREVIDGLEILDKDGRKIVWTAIRGRDELFNRLIAMDGQKWEQW
ncbi:Protein of unknown function DUF3292 [Abortiporus biennis]